MRSITNRLEYKKNRLIKRLERVDEPDHDRQQFEKHLLSKRGRRSLSCLWNSEAVALWEYALTPYFDDNENKLIFSRTVIELLLECIPEILFEDSENLGCDGIPLLGVMLRYSCDIMPTDLMLRAIDLNPGRIIDQKSKYIHLGGNLLLHIAMYFSDTPLCVIRHIYEAFPEAISHKNFDGCLPLHLILSSLSFYLTEKTVQCVEFILSKYTCAISDTDRNGYLPLHYIFDPTSRTFWTYYEQDETIFQKLVNMIYKAYPEAIKTSTPSELNYPLHLVCSAGKSMFARKEVIFFLIKTYPQAIFETNKDGFTPLDYVSRYNGKIHRFMTYLIEDDNMKLMETIRDERNGNNVLHAFSRNCHPVEPNSKEDKGASATNHGGNRKHRGAIGKGEGATKHQMYHQLISYLPRLTLQRNYNGDIPLHVRLCSSCGTDLLFHDIQVLLDAMNKATRHIRHKVDPLITMHNNGLLPFMMAACRDEPCVTSIFFLLQRFVAVNGTLFNIYCPEEKNEHKRRRLTE